MAKIFVSLYNFGRHPEDYNMMPPFFESFLNGLKDAGNQVLCFQHKIYRREFIGRIPSRYRTKIMEFKPDLCILFNYSFWDISDLVDCPIIIYDTDSPLYFCHTDILKKKTDRFLFVAGQSDMPEVYRQMFSAREDQICHVPFFTAVQPDPDMEQTHTIGFLGANFSDIGCGFIRKYIDSNPSNEDRHAAAEVLAAFARHPFQDFESIYRDNKIIASTHFQCHDYKQAAIELSGINRLEVLNALTDLGLEIRGKYWTRTIMDAYPKVALAFDPAPIWGLKANQDFYNSNIISVNTTHIQDLSGFSFRVCDIMASNSCLVSEYRPDIVKLFPKAKIPTFTNAYEAREQCIRIMHNKNQRDDIIAASHEAIDASYRFRNVLEKLEDFTGLSLHNEEQGSVEIFYEPHAAHYVKNKIYCVLRLKEDLIHDKGR